GDEDRAAEVGGVGELVQQVAELLLRRREAHVDDVEAVSNGPAKAREEYAAAAREARAENANRVQLRLRGDRVDHAGTRGAVPTEIALSVLRRDRASVVVQRDRHGPSQLADPRMAAFDAAVE